MLRSRFQRKLLEVLFDGADEASGDVAAAAERYFASIAAARDLITLPADPKAASSLAGTYRSDALGTIEVRRDEARVVFDFGGFESEVASKQNDDGTTSFVTTTPGNSGFEFVLRDGGAALVTRDSQHEYVFAAAP